MSQNAHLSIPDEELAAALAHIPPKPDWGYDVAAKRKAFEDVALIAITETFRPQLPPENDYRVEDHTVPVDGGEILVRVVIPTPKDMYDSPEFPLMVWLHGGGYSLGNVDMDDYILRRLAVDTRVVIANVDYRLAPEFPFPTGLNDSYAALKWAASNASKFSASPSRGLIVGGSSAGANLAASLALRARDDPSFAENGWKLTGQFLQVPQVVHPRADLGRYKSEIISWEQNKDAPLLTLQELYPIAEQYGAAPTNPAYSVLFAKSHKDLAPAYIQVCGLDPIRDEGILYEKVLSESGVPTKFDVYPGMPHGGHLVASIGTTAIGKKFNEDVGNGLLWLISGAQD
ncbi:hypothetical protein K474DRAFT_1707585 [Panus rudis PR-1116 ss-1]|nr:hypothetical protein K474DRAFT_1707585 [Panus rudis PR-1116 ss-1]